MAGDGSWGNEQGDGSLVDSGRNCIPRNGGEHKREMRILEMFHLMLMPLDCPAVGQVSWY